MTKSSSIRKAKRPTKPAPLSDEAIITLAASLAKKAVDDLVDWAAETAPDDYYFDALAAERAVQFFARYLRHTKSIWAGQPFELLYWQKVIVRLAFGWKRPDGTRRFRVVYIRIPRKNGKTSMAAGVGLYLTFADDETGAEVYSFASDTDQAAIAHDEAKRMRGQSEALRSRSMVYKKSIVVGATSSSYKVLSSTAGTKHGLNASGLIGDELHAMADRELYDTLHTSTAARPQPLEWLTTTAGVNRHSFCHDIDDYAGKVRERIFTDADFLPVMFGADKGDNFMDTRVWAAANPSLGVTIGLDYIRKEAEKAKVQPSYTNVFRRLHLNIWTESHTRWLPKDAWDDCGQPVDPKTLEGRECYGGLDLSRKIDISAFVLVFPPVEDGERWKVLCFFWVPAENILLRAKRDRVPYDVWERAGLIHATEGDVVDYRVILAAIAEDLGPRFNIREIGFDEWNATQLANDLIGEGFEMVAIRQGYKTMSEPMKFTEELIIARNMAHGDNAVLNWMADNIEVRMDANENIAPDKLKSIERIDGMVALIMAMVRAMFHEDEDEGISIPDDYEIMTI